MPELGVYQRDQIRVAELSQSCQRRTAKNAKTGCFTKQPVSA